MDTRTSAHVATAVEEAHEDNLKEAFAGFCHDAYQKLRGSLESMSMTPSVEITVHLLSGEVVTELTLARTATVAQVKDEVAKHDATPIPAGPCKLLLGENELYDETTLQELCVGKLPKLTMHLIRSSGHTFEKIARNGREDYLLKFVIAGNAESGKSSLMSSFVENTFAESYISTIGVDIKVACVRVDGQSVATFQMWDIAGQERFRAIGRSYYRGCQGVVIVFAVTDRASFDGLSQWVEEVSKHTARDTPFCIVGTKEDLQEQRQVAEAEAIEFAVAHGTQYFEVSAKSGMSVAEPFHHLIGMNLDRVEAARKERAAMGLL